MSTNLSVGISSTDGEGSLNTTNKIFNAPGEQLVDQTNMQTTDNQSLGTTVHTPNLWAVENIWRPITTFKQTKMMWTAKCWMLIKERQRSSILLSGSIVSPLSTGEELKNRASCTQLAG